MNTEIKLLEELSLNAHPALNTVYYDGWYLRFAEGYTNRANSVNMLNPSCLPIHDKIKYCEMTYFKQQLPTVFKITPLSVQMDDILAKKDYSIVTSTNLMMMNVPQINTNQLISVVTNGIHEDWQNHYFHLNEMNKNVIPSARKIQGNITNQTLCAVLSCNNEVVACGLGVIERTYVGLYDIIVSPKHRQKGYGQDICLALMSTAAKYGAQKAYLQVVANNADAVGLYQKIGFTDMYQYWYRVKHG